MVNRTVKNWCVFSPDTDYINKLYEQFFVLYVSCRGAVRRRCPRKSVQCHEGTARAIAIAAKGERAGLRTSS